MSITFELLNSELGTAKGSDAEEERSDGKGLTPGSHKPFIYYGLLLREDLTTLD